MVAAEKQILETKNSDKLVEILFADFKKKPTKEAYTAYISVDTFNLIDSMRLRADKIVTAKKASRNDIIEKLANYALVPGSPGYLSVGDISGFSNRGTAKKNICFMLPAQTISLIENAISLFNAETTANISRSQFIDALVVLSAVKSIQK